LRWLHAYLFSLEKVKRLENIDPNGSEYLQIYAELSQKEKTLWLRR
jgi:hypothetical protein